jgi:hypothetical protein
MNKVLHVGLFALLIAGCGRSAPRQDAPAAGPEVKAAPTVEAPKETAPAVPAVAPVAKPEPPPAVVPEPVVASPAAVVPEPVVAPPAPPEPNLAKGAKITASTSTMKDGAGAPEAMLDGDLTTRWSSEFADWQEVLIDLGEPKPLTTVKILWEKAAAKSYSVLLSTDGNAWSDPINKDEGAQGPRVDEIELKADARFIKLNLKERATQWGFSIYEIILAPPTP